VIGYFAFVVNFLLLLDHSYLLSTIGTNNWKCLSENLKSPEHSSLHLKAIIQTWMELKLRISENSTIDRAHQSAMEKEKQH